MECHPAKTKNWLDNSYMVQSYSRINKRDDFNFLMWKLAISRKMSVCNCSMPSTATTVACEVSKFSLGVGLHVATSQSTSASVEGDFRFDEVKWIICWHSQWFCDTWYIQGGSVNSKVDLRIKNWKRRSRSWELPFKFQIIHHAQSIRTLQGEPLF